jgi:hypothetical protein
VQLRACPVFDPAGLVLVRGRGDQPWALPVLPPMGDVRAFARVELRGATEEAASLATAAMDPDLVRVPMRLVPSSAPWRNVSASWIPLEKLPLLRRLVYALPTETLKSTRIALTDRGAFLSCPHGIEAIPLGTFFIELAPGLFTPAGLEVEPPVSSDVLYRAVGGTAENALFISHTGATLAIPNDAFVPLEMAVLEAKPWEAATVTVIESALAEAPVHLKLRPVGLFPLAGAAAARPDVVVTSE